MMVPGLGGGLPAQTSDNCCLQRSTHRWSLGGDCPRPAHTSSTLRSLPLKISKLSGARRAPKNAKQQQPPGAPSIA